MVPLKAGRRWGNDSRPRWVVGELPDTTLVDADDLIKLAKEHTAPRVSKAYADPEETKELFLRARESNDKRDWKAAHRARKKARKLWHEERLRESNDKRDWKAAHRARKKARKLWHEERLKAILEGDWFQYRARQRELSKKRGWWGRMLNERSSADLTKAVHDHLKDKLTNDHLEDWDDLLCAQIDSVQLDTVFEPFTLLDMRFVLHEMKAGSAVGPDGVSVSLLREIASHDGLAPQLLSLVNHIIEQLQMPASRDC
eukprot:s681_g10.t1